MFKTIAAKFSPRFHFKDILIAGHEGSCRKEKIWNVTDEVWSSILITENVIPAIKAK